MKIESFTQGSTDDKRLFALIGPWLVSRDVHKEQGSPITSDAGDVWHVAIDDGKPIGFALTHVQADGAGHVRFLHADRSPAKTRGELLAAVLAWLKDRDTPRAYTYAREDDAVWNRAGFSFVTKRRGSFHTFEKVLKP